MKKIYGLFLGFAFVGSALAQPDQWAVAIDPAQISTIQGAKRVWDMSKASTAITVDGTKDAIWDQIASQPYDRFIKYSTGVSAGVYSTTSMLSDGPSPTRRLPDNNADFSGTYRVCYDEDYVYCFFDVTDNEVNDGTINPINEELEFQEAPYADSAQQLLGTAPFPPYTGAAGLLNKTYCYWGYLGAFKMNFKLVADGKCEVTFRQKADAIAKINYDQRAAACPCAWKIKGAGDGYTAEVAISLRITLADSAGNGFKIPMAKDELQYISFEMKVFDRDLNMKDIQSSWNAEDNNVWDAMLWGGKLLMRGTGVSVPEVKTSEVTFSPNPAVDVVTLSEKVKSVELVSISGATVKAASNVQEINVSDLAAGIYIVKIDGKVAGKLMKQ